MNVSSIWRTKTYRARRSKALLAFFITGFVTVVLAIIVFFGDNTGNYTIRARSDAQKISLSADKSFNEPRTVLRFSGIKNIRALDFPTFRASYLNDVLEEEGRFVRSSFVGYSFYLKNDSERGPIDRIRYYVNVIETTDSIRQLLNVVVLIDDDLTLFNYDGKHGGNLFPDEGVLARDIIYNLREQEVVKITVIFLLEPDPSGDVSDITPDDRIKLNMGIEVLNEGDS